MKAKIYISYKEGILDPQGKTVNHALNSIGIKNIAALLEMLVVFLFSQIKLLPRARGDL